MSVRSTSQGVLVVLEPASTYLEVIDVQQPNVHGAMKGSIQDAEVSHTL